MGGASIRRGMPLTDLLDLNAPATEDAIQQAEEELGIRFPSQFRDFLLESNGGEGSISASYLALWPVEAIAQLNRDYQIDEYTPGLVAFASDDGGMAYAFDTRAANLPIVEIPFESIHIEEAKACGDTFVAFLRYLREEG